MADNLNGKEDDDYLTRKRAVCIDNLFTSDLKFIPYFQDSPKLNAIQDFMDFFIVRICEIGPKKDLSGSFNKSGLYI